MDKSMSNEHIKPPSAYEEEKTINYNHAIIDDDYYHEDEHLYDDYFEALTPARNEISTPLDIFPTQGEKIQFNEIVSNKLEYHDTDDYHDEFENDYEDDYEQEFEDHESSKNLDAASDGNTANYYKPEIFSDIQSAALETIALAIENRSIPREISRGSNTTNSRNQKRVPTAGKPLETTPTEDIRISTAGKVAERSTSTDHPSQSVVKEEIPKVRRVPKKKKIKKKPKSTDETTQSKSQKTLEAKPARKSSIEYHKYQFDSAVIASNNSSIYQDNSTIATNELHDLHDPLRVHGLQEDSHLGEAVSWKEEDEDDENDHDNDDNYDHVRNDQHNYHPNDEHLVHAKNQPMKTPRPHYQYAQYNYQKHQNSAVTASRVAEQSKLSYQECQRQLKVQLRQLQLYQQENTSLKQRLNESKLHEDLQKYHQELLKKEQMIFELTEKNHAQEKIIRRQGKELVHLQRELSLAQSNEMNTAIDYQAQQELSQEKLLQLLKEQLRAVKSKCNSQRLAISRLESQLKETAGKLWQARETLAVKREEVTIQEFQNKLLQEKIDQLQGHQREQREIDSRSEVNEDLQESLQYPTTSHSTTNNNNINNNNNNNNTLNTNIRESLEKNFTLQRNLLQREISSWKTRHTEKVQENKRLTVELAKRELFMKAQSHALKELRREYEVLAEHLQQLAQASVFMERDLQSVQPAGRSPPTIPTTTMPVSILESAVQLPSRQVVGKQALLADEIEYDEHQHQQQQQHYSSEDESSREDLKDTVFLTNMSEEVDEHGDSAADEHVNLQDSSEKKNSDQHDALSSERQRAQKKPTENEKNKIQRLPRLSTSRIVKTTKK